MDQSLAPHASSVLIVDDNKDAVDMLTEVLTAEGFGAFAAYSGEEGFKLAEQLRPSIALLDLSMPDIDGLDLCRRIRSQPWGLKIKIIAISGWTLQEYRDAAKVAGCDAYLIKPSSLDDLVTAIRGEEPRPELSILGADDQRNNKSSKASICPS